MSNQLSTKPKQDHSGAIPEDQEPNPSGATRPPNRSAPFTKEFTRLVAKLRAETQEHPEQSDIPPVTFHGLRHSHATQLLKAGIHPKIAQERLGHSTIAVTLDLYSHVTETMQEDAARMVDNALRVAINERTNGEQ